ncbi:MAG TPA: WbqC family protein [Burkholderiales bacterium]|jgi:hypothetical protein|nr:WbqC family protein [Burkholderiales bacterium]
MQPTYFPWAGYFNLIAQVDVFVFLDDAQYEKSSWQNRNRILLNGQPHWLTVPGHRNHLGQSIIEIGIDDKRNWRDKQFRLLQQAYTHHPYVDEMLAAAGIILDRNLGNLAELNIRIVTHLMHEFDIATRILRSSTLDLPGKRTERLVKICEHLGCTEYVAPIGSTEYLAEDGFTEMTSISLLFNSYVPDAYSQVGSKSFVSHLSILDVLANIGKKAASEYVRGIETRNAASIQ